VNSNTVQKFEVHEIKLDSIWVMNCESSRTDLFGTIQKGWNISLGK
jgi:hypothetical protein